MTGFEEFQHGGDGVSTVNDVLDEKYVAVLNVIFKVQGNAYLTR